MAVNLSLRCSSSMLLLLACSLLLRGSPHTQGGEPLLRYPSGVRVNASGVAGAHNSQNVYSGAHNRPHCRRRQRYCSTLSTYGWRGKRAFAGRTMGSHAGSKDCSWWSVRPEAPEDFLWRGDGAPPKRGELLLTFLALMPAHVAVVH